MKAKVPSKLDRIVAEARRVAAKREQGYREQALQLYPWTYVDREDHDSSARRSGNRNLQLPENKQSLAMRISVPRPVDLAECRGTRFRLPGRSPWYLAGATLYSMPPTSRNPYHTTCGAFAPSRPSSPMMIR